MNVIQFTIGDATLKSPAATIKLFNTVPNQFSKNGIKKLILENIDPVSFNTLVFSFYPFF